MKQPTTHLHRARQTVQFNASSSVGILTVFQQFCPRQRAANTELALQVSEIMRTFPDSDHIAVLICRHKLLHSSFQTSVGSLLCFLTSAAQRSQLQNQHLPWDR